MKNLFLLILFIFLFVNSRGSSGNPTPILEYKFNSCSLASTVADSQGSYNGTVTGTATSVSTSVLGGRSLDLSGTSTSDWVTVPKSAITGLDDLSFSVWIKTGISSPEQTIIQALGNDTNDNELQIYINGSSTVILKLRDNEENLSATTLTNNTWHHLVITRQSDTVCLYVDGSQTDCDNGASTGTLSVSYSNSVVIGQEQDSTRSSANLNSGFDSTQSFKGYLDELKIYNSALSSSQVQVLYTDEASGDNTLSCEADLIASYNFDDDWVSNSSLTDQTGSYNGTPSGSVSQVSAEASGFKGDTCNAGSFTGGAIDVSGLPVSTSTGAKTSVSFWMYWDGTENVMPMGWFLHDLWLVAGFFGFNTDYNDITGIFSSVLNAGWHHVAAVFTNGSVSNNKIYIDGTLQSLFTPGYWFGYQYYNIPGYGYPYTPHALVTSALRIGGRTDTSYFNFRGKLDNFKVYNGTITQTQVTSDMNKSNACPGVDTPAVAFNCVENGSHAISGSLYTKTTAQSYSFDIIALRDANTVETSFADGADHTITIDLVDSSSAGSCSAYSVLSPAVSQSLLITSSDAGNKASAPMTSGTAYSSVKCRVTDATDSPSVVGCSTDSFAIRPTTFNSVTSNMTNTGFTATPKAKAGDNFTLTASSTTGYTGTPTIDNTKVEAHSGAIQNGSIAGSFTAASSAAATGSSFTYSEAGAFRFLTAGIYDDSFTAIDQASDCTDDFSNTIISGKVGCKFGNTANTAYFGRFTPDHFVVTASTDGVLTNACTGFTYTGQAFNYQSSPTLTITAYNGYSPVAVTQNYTGSYASGINATDFNVTTPTTDTIQLGVDLSNKVNLSWTIDTPTVTDNGDGSHTFNFGSDTYTYTHEDNSLIAPFNNTIDLIFTNITDDDLIQATGLPHTVQASGTSTRYGRININNAHGSELVDLAMPLTTQYWNGNAWVLNTADQCSLLSLSLTDPLTTDGLTIAELCVLDNGSPGNSGLGCATADISSKKFNEPTTLSPGDFNLYFKAPGSGNIGSLDITATVENYLKFNWKNTGKINPTARITFGIYKGNSNQIYFKELY
ncbi:MAG: DUF6701 domain-containing protein [Methylococcaceae bacterium]